MKPKAKGLLHKSALLSARVEIFTGLIKFSMLTPYRPTFAQHLVRLSYSLLTILLVPLTVLHFLLQYFRGKAGYDRKRLSRYGIVAGPIKKGGLLIHCASVGEVVAAHSLIKMVLDTHPKHPVTITTNTTTGAMRVKELLNDDVMHIYLPYDVGLFMQGLLGKLQPRMVLINEMELWPNLIHACWTRHIPVYLINGRMSDKSKKTYSRFPKLFSPMFSKITGICAQGQRDYANYLAMNIPPEKLTLTNNIKFDMPLDDNDRLNGLRLADKLALGNRAILLAGSTHAPEEQVLIEAFKKMATDFPDLLLVIAPRHPQRFEKVARVCEKSGLEFIKASENKPCQANTQILLLDQMGLLRSAYSLAKIAFVGGSIADRGGHNALEPAVFGVPILMGPHIYNNPAICQALMDAGALYTVNTAQHIVARCTLWLRDEELRLKDGLAGAKVLQQNGGAIEATLKVLSLSTHLP
ncbi:MAG: 3-deoxy-D-manno-octulosonic-acid transferase [Paraglaciecola sp.]|jgi:3-deoxy-D-manno-octulosonic-acid transferase